MLRAARMSALWRALTRSIPEGARDTELPCHVGRLQESSGPGPLGDNIAGSQTDLHRATSSGEGLRGVVVTAELLVQPHHAGGQDSEGQAQTDDDEVTCMPSPASVFRRHVSVAESATL
jgi:hypothetical protein